MDDSQLAVTASRLRIGFGIALLATPRLATRLLSGRKATGVEPALARMVGARDIGFGLGAVIAIDRGAPVRGWLEGAALADLADAAAALLAPNAFAPAARRGVLVIGTTATALNLYLSRRLDPAPVAEPGHPEAAITGHPEVTGPHEPGVTAP